MREQTDHQVELLKRRGFCLLKKVIPEASISITRELILREEVLQTEARAGWTRTSNGRPDPTRYQKLSKAMGIVAKLGPLSSFIAAQPLMSVVKQVLGGYVRVSSDFGIVTFPGNPRGFWHSDWPYNQTMAAHLPQPYGDMALHLGALFMLTDFTVANGGTLILPGSHLRSTNPTGRGGAEEAAPHPDEEQITGQKGDVFLYDARLWHCVAEHKDQVPRVTLAVRYAPWWLNLEVRREGSLQARLVEQSMKGRGSFTQLLSPQEFETLPEEVKPLYAHWVEVPSSRPKPSGLDAHGATPPPGGPIPLEAPRGEAEGSLPRGSKAVSMSEPDGAALPLVDDTALFDLRVNRYALPMTQLALDLGLFELLQEAPASIADTAKSLGCGLHAAEALLAVESALGFLRASADGRFSPTQAARTYLLRSSPFYRQRVLEASDPTLHQLRGAFSTSERPISPLAGELDGVSVEDIRDFIERMDAFARPAAGPLAQKTPLRNVRRLLDVGGGSGRFSIAIAQHHPDMSCTVFDRGPVCALAQENIAHHALSSRVKIHEGNMLTDPWPRGHDGILLASVMHNWDPETCRLLAHRAWEVLEPGGLLLLHEMPLDELKNGPLPVACFSVEMLLKHRGKQYTIPEFRELLKANGFEDFHAERSFGHYFLLWARKPR